MHVWAIVSAGGCPEHSGHLILRECLDRQLTFFNKVLKRNYSFFLPIAGRSAVVGGTMPLAR